MQQEERAGLGWWPRWMALGILLVGWRVFWFVCDDAYITFRYAQSRQLGWGYTWNPPPFEAVEGYTSLLWLLLVDLAWTLTGVEPPVNSTWLGLAAATGSVLFVAAMIDRLTLPGALGRARPWLGALVLLGVVTNKSFLVWTSSGLETPLYVMLLLGWAWWACAAERGPRWPLIGASLAGLAAITRPDGMLFWAATPVVVGAAAYLQKSWGRRDLLQLLPLGLVPAHVVWRFFTYGYPLPNTYYAKVSEPWIYGGGNQFWLYTTEYAVFLWLPLFVAATVASWSALTDRDAWVSRLPTALGVAAILAHLTWWILLSGGDHFEFRIFAHLPGLLFVLALWLLARMEVAPTAAGATLGLLVVSSWVLPWTDYAHMRQLTLDEEIRKLHVPLADKVPAAIRPWAALHDRLEHWCVRHGIAASHQTHKWFRIRYAERLPSREEGLAMLGASDWRSDDWATSFPIVALNSVGVPAWNMPYIAIIDRFGLNDRVIARNPPKPSRFRFSAHDRKPPEGYVECFRPNATVLDGVTFKLRSEPYDAEVIRACEAEHLARVVALDGAYVRPPKDDELDEDGDDAAGDAGEERVLPAAVRAVRERAAGD